ncbi:MAG: RecX family transcriptional regulator [Phycisphaerales bacterium]
MAASARIVTSIASAPQDPSVVRVAIDGAVVGDVLRATADALGLRVGARVSSAKLVRLAEAIDLAAARAAALRMLGRSDRTASQLAAQLVARGHPERAAGDAVRLLADDGWIDDARYASERARRLAARKPVAHAFVQATLVEEGVEERTASRAAKAAAPRDGDLARAVAAAKAALGRAGARDRKLVRRTAASLARAGFDADTIAAAFAKAGVAFPEE